MPIRRIPLIALLMIVAGSNAYPVQETPASQPAETTMQREDQVRRRVLRDFQSDILAAKSALTELREAADKHAKNLKDLLSNDAGKRLARDAVAVMTYVQIRDEPPPPADFITRKLQTVEDVQQSVEAKLAMPFIEDLPAPQTRREILDAYAWAKGKADRLADRRDSLQALLATASNEGDVSKSATLEQAISEYKNRYTRFLNEGWQKGEAQAAGRAQQTMSEAGEKAALEQANQKARLELEKANAEISRMKAEHDVELRRLREEQEQKLADVDRQLAIARAARLKQEAETTVIAQKGEEDAAKVLKRKRCQDPELKSLLASLLAEGYRQPGQHEPTIDKQPISLGALRSVGALERTVTGLSLLTEILRHDGFYDPDRPMMTFPGPYVNLSGPEMEKIKKIQATLNELGETMVEMRMLAP
ncbi:MAG: hypothetical protein IPM64_00130 [Phycisphaerales bacterium]|nr:hypothetical protein [Phycisphaerales bacterium]